MLDSASQKAQEAHQHSSNEGDSAKCFCGLGMDDGTFPKLLCIILYLLF